MFPEDALNYDDPVVLKEETEDEVLITFEGTVNCREIKKGKLYYHIKASRGYGKEIKIVSHDELVYGIKDEPEVVEGE